VGNKAIFYKILDVVAMVDISYSHWSVYF